MSDSGSWIEIVLLAMLAGFIGLRLISVLGKRTGHERPVGDSYRPGAPELTPPLARGTDTSPRVAVAVPVGTDATLAPALQAVHDADPSFDPERFVEGSKSAYRMVLESFWAGDAAALGSLMSDQVQDQFAEAIAARDGSRLANSLAGIDSATITGAQMVGQMAEVTVKFAARVVTDGGAPVANSDVWTFSRHIGTRDPNWLLIATDEE